MQPCQTRLQGQAQGGVDVRNIEFDGQSIPIIMPSQFQAGRLRFFKAVRMQITSNYSILDSVAHCHIDF